MNTLAAKKKGRRAKAGPLLLIALPGIVYLVINNYIPMFGIFLAFKDYNYAKGIFGSDWSGLANFQFLFATRDAFIMTRNTILYNAVFIVLGNVVSIAVAIFMSGLGTRLRVKFYQSVLLLPNLLSWVVISVIVYAFLNADTGFVNDTLLKGLGLQAVSWYTSKQYWPFILTAVYLWKMIGFLSIVYMATIAGIDTAIFESADLDGASEVKKIWYITLPMLKPTVIMLTLLAIGRIFYSDFGLFYQVPQNSGALFDVTQTIDTYVYRGLMVLNNVGMSAAAAFYQSIVGFVLVLLANWLVRRVDSENALF